MKKLLPAGYWLLIYLIILLMHRSAIAQETQSDDPNIKISEIYFLSIGSQHYLQDKFFKTGSAPIKSAEKIAEILQERGAKYGILLISDSHQFISRQDILKALTDLKHQIRKDNSGNPLIFFYFMGHGLGDQASSYLYLTPGNFYLEENSNSQYMTIKLLKTTVSNLDIITSLTMFKLHPTMAHWDDIYSSNLMPDITSPEDVSKVTTLDKMLLDQDEYYRNNGLYPANGNPSVPFVAMFDNCYGGVVQNLVDNSKVKSHSFLGSVLNNWIAKQQEQTLHELAQLEEDGLVLYSDKPGTKIGEFDNPKDDDFFPIGALARRFILALSLLSSETNITLLDLRQSITSPELEKNNNNTRSTPIPYSISATKPEIQKAIIFSDVRHKRTGLNSFEKRLGTATNASYCCSMR